MTRFILRRLLVSIPVLFGVLFAVFAIARVIPGSPCNTALGERATPAKCAEYDARHGLDKPIPEQFVVYLGELAQGDLGTSTKYSRPVGTILIERLPLTVELSILALLFAIAVGVPLGVVSAARRNSPLDVGTMMLANLGVSIPIFVLGLLLAYLFAVVLKDTPISLPPSGRLSPGTIVRPLADVWGLQSVSGPARAGLDFLSGIYTFNGLVTTNWSLLGDALRHLILPALALGTIPLAIIARITRSSLLDVLGQDFVRTARAKGLRERRVVLRHGLGNAMLPVATVIGLQLGGLLSGAVLTETIFRLGGVGSAIYEAVIGRDYQIIQGFAALVAVVFIVVNLLVDVSYAKLDPRVRVS
ncbi:MAG: ABC transporter permease [Actinobacteria bacterium]|nr:ABC transporter permease [Actinomycetota bacterium]